MESVKMQRMTLSSYWSFMLQDLFNFYDLSLKAVLIGEQEAMSGLRECQVMPCPRTALLVCHPSCHRDCYIGGLCVRFESGINTNIFLVFLVLFKKIRGAHSELRKAFFSSNEAYIFL